MIKTEEMEITTYYLYDDTWKTTIELWNIVETMGLSEKAKFDAMKLMVTALPTKFVIKYPTSKVKRLIKKFYKKGIMKWD